MKNFVPLVIAVLLGLAAVLAVGRLLKARSQAMEDTIEVVAAATDIAEGDILSDSNIMGKEVPVSAVPVPAIYWSRSRMVVGQKAMRSIVQGDYVLLDDVGLSKSMADVVGEGEWAVTLRVPAGGIARVLQPGDEIAVIGTFEIESTITSADLAAAPKKVTKEATVVLFPRVRVLDIGGMDTRGASGSQGSEIIVSLPPRQAQVLVAAQREASLTLALRRPGDAAAISRMDSGMVDKQTFDNLLKGLESVKMPAIPGRPPVTAAKAKPAE